MASFQVVQFGNRSPEDRKLLRKFVYFHWDLYRNEPQYIPLLDYEYLGFKPLGITGYFEPSHLFFQHGEITFFLAERNGKIIGRVCAYVNHNHNKHTGDRIGFFGHFDCIDDHQVSDALLKASATWLKSRGMNVIRGPQNFPVNEATPGALIEGYNTLPVIYYHWNYPYYQQLMKDHGMYEAKKVVSLTISTHAPIQERMGRLIQRIRERADIRIEPFDVKRKKEYAKWMLDLYNAAWNDNWGFVPMTPQEFFKNLEDMQLVWDPELFLFAFVNGEPASFLGLVPNICAGMKPSSGLLRRAELIRAARMILSAKRVKSLRLGYFGIHPKFRKMGLDALLISKGQELVIQKGYEVCDIGWVLENNDLILRLSESIGAVPARTYAVFEKQLS
jgi:hypothetical protein